MEAAIGNELALRVRAEQFGFYEKLTRTLAVVFGAVTIVFGYLRGIEIYAETDAMNAAFLAVAIVAGVLFAASFAATIACRAKRFRLAAKNPLARKKRQRWYVFDYVNVIIMVLFMVCCIYPIVYVVAGSFNVGSDYSTGGVWLLPREFTFENYEIVLADPELWSAYLITISRTVFGTVAALLFTSIVAYAMSRRELPFKSFFHWANIITMFFGGGLVPTFLVMRMLGLLNSYFVYILPGLYSVYNMIIICNFFRGIPEELHEAAVMDGASETRIFSTIYLPLSKPVIATVALWVGIGHWNSFFDCMIYITDVRTLDSLQTLQYYLLQVINSSTLTEGMPAEQMERISSKTISMAAILVAIVPLFFAFPLIKRNFNSGIMIGSLKG